MLKKLFLNGMRNLTVTANKTSNIVESGIKHHKPNQRINISVMLVSESYVLLYYEKKFICYLSIKYV